MSQITDDHDYLISHNTLWLELAKNTQPTLLNVTLIVYFSCREIGLVLVGGGRMSSLV